VQPAEADCRAREEAARGHAALVVERGKAEAGALQRLCAAYAAAGPGAREVMALQQVIPLLPQVAGSDRALQVHKVSVLPPDGEGGGGFAKAAIRAAEQIKAATGLDLAALADRSKKP